MPRPLAPLSVVILGCVIACGGAGRPPGGDPALEPAGATSGTNARRPLPAGVRADSPVGRWLAWLDGEQKQRAAEARAAWDRDVEKARAGVRDARERYDALAAGDAPFSRRVKARADLLDAHKRLRVAQETRPRPAPVPTTIDLDALRPGTFGRLADPVVLVNQVVDGRTMIVKTGRDTLVWVEGNTSGLVDRQGVRLGGLVECYGTERYVTVIGGTRTVAAVREHPGVELPEPPRVEVPPPDPVPEVPEPTREPVAPPPGWSSGWQQLGQVKARVRAVAHAPAPIADRDGDRTFSPEKVALVWVEFRNAGPHPRTVRRYQPSSECVLAGEDRAPLAGPTFPAGRSLDHAAPFSQPLPPGGGSVVALLAFDVASPPTGPLTLTLDASRVGEVGRYVLAIPASAWREGGTGR